MYTAVDGQTQEHIGHIELTRIDQQNRKANIVYVLVDPAKRGFGYGNALMQCILQECFERMNMLRVDLFVFKCNPVAIHCYQKAGFEIEEVIEDRIKLKDHFVTLYLMGAGLRKMDGFHEPATHSKINEGGHLFTLTYQFQYSTKEETTPRKPPKTVFFKLFRDPLNLPISCIFYIGIMGSMIM